MEDYLKSVADQNENSAKTYRVRLLNFQKYLASLGTDGIDEVIAKLKSKELDPYALCADFASYIIKQGRAPYYQSQIMKTTKNLLVFHDVEISDHKFRLKVRLKKVVRRKKLGLSIDDVREIINGCRGDMRLFTYVSFLAATGCRAAEVLHLKNRDLHLDDKQPYVFILGENTKTGADRTVYLTDELVKTLKAYLQWKYRERRTKYDHDANKRYHEKFVPDQSRDDLLFQPYHHAGVESTAIKNLYVDLSVRLVRVLERLGMAEREEHNSRRHKITFHSFRRFVKTTISDLGYSDFSEFFIGHAGSSYWTKPEHEKVQLFQKIQPYITFLDIEKLEAHGADQKTRLDQLQADLQKEREERDKLYAKLYKEGIIKKE